MMVLFGGLVLWLFLMVFFDGPTIQFLVGQVLMHATIGILKKKKISEQTLKVVPQYYTSTSSVQH